MPKLILTTLSLIALLLGPPGPGCAMETITVAATRSMIDSYRDFLRGRSPYEITSFTSSPSTPHASRSIVVMIMMLQAMKIGGMGEVGISFVETPNSARERAEVKSGRAVVGGQDYWSYDFDDSVFMSPPIVDKGQFVKGIYVLPSNKGILAVRDKQHLQRYTAVILNGWAGDIALLRSLNLKDLLYTYNDENLFLFLKLGRADFTLLEFSSAPDLSVTQSGVTLVPVPRVKVTLPGSRCLMISKVHPDGRRVYEALAKGLEVLQENGTFTRVFRESGFIPEQVKDWKTIN